MMGGKCKCMRLSACAFGISLGIITGLCMMLLAWASWMWGFGTSMVDQWATVFPGVSASLTGSFVSLAWGFLEGFILGLIWAWVYNLCLCCCRCCPCCTNSSKECGTK